MRSERPAEDLGLGRLGTSGTHVRPWRMKPIRSRKTAAKTRHRSRLKAGEIWRRGRTALSRGYRTRPLHSPQHSPQHALIAARTVR